MGRKMKSKEGGFTLVELMIAVVIIGILATVAIPKFRAIVARAKLTELKQGLFHIINLEKTYYYANDRYVGFKYGEDSPELGFIQPSGHFTYQFDVKQLSASGKENGVANDINFDDDGKDGLKLHIDGKEDVVKGDKESINFSW